GHEDADVRRLLFARADLERADWVELGVLLEAQIETGPHVEGLLAGHVRDREPRPGAERADEATLGVDDARVIGRVARRRRTHEDDRAGRRREAFAGMHGGHGRLRACCEEDERELSHGASRSTSAGREQIALPELDTRERSALEDEPSARGARVPHEL